MLSSVKFQNVLLGNIRFLLDVYVSVCLCPPHPLLTFVPSSAMQAQAASRTAWLDAWL